MPVEAAKSPTSNPVPLAEANAQNTPKKKQAVGKAALAKITLLDGSVLDVTIDVSELGENQVDKLIIIIFCCVFSPFSEKQREKI